MRYAYPVQLTPEPDGGLVVTFPDVPGAVTQGDDRKDALAQAPDCLIAALGGYIELRRPVPRPSSPRRGQPTIALPSLAAAKLALYDALTGAGLTRVALAQRLGVDERTVRRMLDLDHRSHIGQIEAALQALGKRLEIEVQDAA